MKNEREEKKDKEIYKRAIEQLALLFVALLDEQETLKASPVKPRCPESDPDG